jgi:phage terminase large subunit GpA-like protein
MFASVGKIYRDGADLVRAPRRIPVSEAAINSMRVPTGGSQSKPWEATLTPYIIEPMNCLASREYDAVVFVGPARTGKTNALIDGWLSYVVAYNPVDMLIVQISEEKAREFSKKRVDRMFRVSPDLTKRLSPYRNDNNVHDKIFRAGNYLKIGWPSVNIFSSSDWQYVALTDYDRLSGDIDGEGNAYSLASKRTTTFMSSGMVLVESSPGWDVEDPRWRPSTMHEAPPCQGIFNLYNQGDRRKLYWPCPKCGEYFQPNRANMHWLADKDLVKASESAHVKCPHCETRIEASQKRQLNNLAVWLRDGESIDKHGTRTGTPRRSRIASFWMEGPAAAFQTWQQLVYKLLAAEHAYDTTGEETTLKTVLNTDWGQPYLPRNNNDDRNVEELMDRAEEGPKRVVPHGVRFLIAAVDVQGGKNRRFVVQIMGFGVSGERWVIDRYNIKYSLRHTEDGEADRIQPGGYLEDWDLLISDVMKKSYPLDDDSGCRMKVLATACDHGGEDGVSDNAYKFYRKLKRKGLARRFHLVKGDSSKRATLITETHPDNTSGKRKASAAGDVPLLLLQTDALKDRLAANLSRTESGPGYYHTPNWLGEWFYEELLAETRGPDGKWRKISSKAPNEAIDLSCYADAIASILGYHKMNWDNPKSWAKVWDDNPNVISPEEQTSQRHMDKSTKSEKTKPEEKPQAKAKGNGWLGDTGGWL